MLVKSEKDQSSREKKIIVQQSEQRKKDKIIKYFAYGSNLSKDQMRERVGDWKKAEKASLQKWKLIFNVKSSTWGGGAANVKKTGNPNDVVWGVIYSMTQEQLDVLTSKYEKISPQFKKVECDNQKRFAWVYIFSPNKPSLKPADEYLDTIKTGLREHGYPEDIIRYVTS